MEIILMTGMALGYLNHQNLILLQEQEVYPLLRKHTTAHCSEIIKNTKKL